MAVLGDILFHRQDRVGLSDALRHQVSRLRGVVDALREKTFFDMSDDEIATDVVQKEAIVPLEMNLGAATVKVEEIEIEAADRFGFGFGDRPVRMSGLRAIKSIPFTGDPELWRLRPNNWSLNPPRGEIRRNVLVVGISVPAGQADEAANYIEQTISSLPDIIAQQKGMIGTHNDALATQATPFVKARRERLSAASALMRKLGG